jgi:CheY-like chemotaxis protein
MARILIIDDEATLRLLMKTVLQKEGHQVTEAANGEDGLKIVQELKPEVILLDVLMPGTNGHQVSLELKKNPQTKSIPVVMVTGTSLIAGEGIQTNTVIDLKLSKPFGREELVNIVNQALNR